MASFQAKIVWKMPRKREIKNYRFVPFVPDGLQKIPKKFKKKKKKPLWLHFKLESVERGLEREKIKFIVSFRPYLMRYRKFQKKLQKN